MISAYLKLSGVAVGKIIGPVRDRDTDKNESIALHAVEHSVVSPRDAASGMVSGKRRHHPITLTKRTDHTSPQFYQLLTRNDMIPKAEIFFFGNEERGGIIGNRERILYKVTLIKAFVSRVEFSGRVDAEAKDGDRFPLTERISIVYDSILWEWTEHPKTESQDVFNAVD